MLKKFAWWFICFGLSFLVSDVFGWCEQGKAFLYINLGVQGAIIMIMLIVLIIVGIVAREKLLASGISIVVALSTAAILAITLFATWGATKLLNVDFFVVYQIMTFGQCLCNTNNKKESND